MDARGAGTGYLNGPAHDLGHAQLVDHVDGEGGHARLLHAQALGAVNVPAADLYAVGHIHIGGGLAEIHHAVGAKAAHGRKGHAVHVAREGAVLVVPVPVGVDPNDADGFSWRA